ncbi:MAG: BON domain-containing protein [Verrucomicrobiota bacterium]
MCPRKSWVFICGWPSSSSNNQTAGESDRLLAQRIRKILQSDSTLSSTTQNVKVSATDGRITLRGSVSSENEKKAIEEKVKQATIDNQLQIKNSSNP